MEKGIKITGHIIVGFDKRERETITRKVTLFLPEKQVREIRRSRSVISSNERKHRDANKRLPFCLDGSGYYFTNHDKPHRSHVFIPELCHPDFTQEEAEPTPQELERMKKRKEQLKALPKILKELPPKQHKRIRMYFWEGLTMREIAEIEGVHISSIHKSIQAALKTIVNKL